MLAALLHLHLMTVQQSRADDLISAVIINNKKYTSYFNDCLDALDSSHFDVHVCGENSALYHNHKERLSQNVLTVCNFELQFIYILTD